ncbi:MvaI/BcnI family restriction endonuclease [Pseudidiomarina sp. CB1]|uniref:MvaI/BcnI family restriction endonuclease n=1 Tax=Pseudidiomarina sp. CB1 TaxID=2972484 RepID=UPI0021617DAA|nr:MvaI/BcnI family restriction endonuclease [Pseudidiomarina sp. CB1]
MKSFKDLPSISRIKQRAKLLKKSEKISHSAAYQKLSEQYGFSSWQEFRKALLKSESARPNIPQPSIKFVSDEDVEMSDKDYEVLERERTSDIPIQERELVAENKKELTKLGIEFSTFEPTLTGLKKSILDATQVVRTLFELKGFHSYDEQGQGLDHKVKRHAFLLSDKRSIKSSVSLYRPMTKKGDPRMWFSKLPQYCEAGDQIAIIVFKDSLYLLNLSKVRLSVSLSSKSSAITIFLNALREFESSVAEELLSKLRLLALEPMPALRGGSTGVGYTIESRLGIAANSSKDPDYKGIEIKSGRGGKNRTTLFAQVPNWELSPCKKSAEILNRYGYERDDDFKLYCTVSTQRENTQGLSFIYDETKDQLQEWYTKSELVAVWSGKLLRQRLKEKHSETFWIHAESEFINGVEHFQLISVTHTKAPILSQLLPLIENGLVTMDHLIKRSGKTNRVSEKGPLFKINKTDLNLLFPEPITYILNTSDEKTTPES